MPEVASIKASSRWSTRMIPLFLGAAVGYATYVVVALVCGKFQFPLWPWPWPWPWSLRITEFPIFASRLRFQLSSSGCPGPLLLYPITPGPLLPLSGNNWLTRLTSQPIIYSAYDMTTEPRSFY